MKYYFAFIKVLNKLKFKVKIFQNVKINLMHIYLFKNQSNFYDFLEVFKIVD